MAKSRIVFFGTRIWELTSKHLNMFLEKDANIVAFVEASKKNISTTVTKEDPYENITEVGARLNIPIFAAENMTDSLLIKFLKEFKADVFIVCGFQFYFPEEVLNIPKLGVLNFHSSILPRHAGMHPGFFTIYYGDKESGMAIHYMDSSIDAGDIAYQSVVPVYKGDDIASLYDRIWNSSETLIDRLLIDLDKKALPRIPQDMKQYFYNYEISVEDYKLDFRIEAEILFNRVSMMPGKFYFKFDNIKYFVQKCEEIKQPLTDRFYSLREPFIYKDKLTFITPKNYLQINEIIKEGKTLNPLSIIHI